MQFDSISSKNGHRRKRFKKWTRIKNKLKWYRQCKMLWATSYCFNSNEHIPLGGQHVSVWIGIPLGGSISLYVTKLDLVLNSIWFRCCKNWIYFILKNMKYDLNISCVKFFKINQHNFFPLFLFNFLQKIVCCQHLFKSLSIFIFHPNVHP